MPGILPARNGHAATAIMRRTSPIWIGLYLERQPLTPGAPLALTGPAGQPVPVIRDTATAASTRPDRPARTAPPCGCATRPPGCAPWPRPPRR